nr:ankyrin repeat-containing protein [Tanacetum cinerariifolium]
MPETTKSATKVGPYIPPIPRFNDGLRRDYDDIGFPLPKNTLESSSTMGKNHKVSFFEKEGSVKTNARKVNDLNDDQFRHTDGGSTFVHEIEPQEQETHQNSEHRMRKLKMPIFEGDDAHGWIYRVERYFEVQGVIRRERLLAATLCLEGEALAWYRWYEQQPFESWDHLKEELLDRFQFTKGDLYQQFLSIVQTGTLREY